MMQLVCECQIGGLRHDTFLVQETQDPNDAATALDQVDCGLQIEPEINVVPFNAFTRILFLLKHEHMVVKELLKLFVCVVDQELLVRINFEDLEASNIEHADER